jgi:nitrite reductase/ring-hydroxylating ferredoxin subunit
MDRRRFLRSSCFGCAAFALGAVTLTGCSSLPVIKVAPDQDRLAVPLTAFAEGNKVLLRAPKLPYDILVIRLSTDQYRALYLRCTHEDQPVTATESSIHCTAHGSRFDLAGAVEHGPATDPLRTFPASLEREQVVVRLHA